MEEKDREDEDKDKGREDEDKDKDKGGRPGGGLGQPGGGEYCADCGYAHAPGAHGG